MTDFGTMQSRIARELRRSNLTTEIQEAIKTSIRDLESEHLWFQRHRQSIILVVDQEKYPLPDDYKEMRSLTITDGTTTYDPLTPITQGEYDELQTGVDFNGIPASYYTTRIGGVQHLILWPDPDKAYVMTMVYDRDLAAVSASTDTNEWFTDGENVLRSAAKANLFAHVIRDQGNAQIMASAASMALANLRARSNRIRKNHQLRPRM